MCITFLIGGLKMRWKVEELKVEGGRVERRVKKEEV